MKFMRTGWIVASLLVAGCIPKFVEPELRLDGIRLGALGLGGGTLYAQIVLANPNTYELRSAAMRYAIAMKDAAGGSARWLDVASGSIDHEVRVAASDSVAIEVPVDFSYSGIGGAIRTVLATGTVEYRLTGDLRIVAPIRRSVPFRRSGRVDVAATPSGLD